MVMVKLRCIENPRVGSSILPPATIYSKAHSDVG